MPKEIFFSKEARNKLIRGAEKAADAARITLGAKGQNVIFEFPQLNQPIVTNDGVTILQQVVLEDKTENMGAQLVIQASRRTNDMAGDGTTTCAILSRAILLEGKKAIEDGANPMGVKRGIEKAVKEIVKYVKKTSIPVSGKEDIAKVAEISSGDKEIGKTISDIFEKIGKDGVIAIEEGFIPGVSMEVVEGMRIESGYVSQYFVTDPQSQKSEIDNPLILVTDKPIKTIYEVAPFLKMAKESKNMNIVIICSEISNDVLAFLVNNKFNQNQEYRINPLVIKAPISSDRKDYLEDIAIATGATLVTSDRGMKLEEITPDVIGSAKQVVSTKTSTAIIGGFGNQENIKERISLIKKQIKEEKEDKTRLVDRLSKMSNGVGIIRIGANTEVELREKKYRTEDAIEATKAAIEMGIVPGGGTTLLRFEGMIDAEDRDEVMGAEAVFASLEYPIRQIADNCGVDGNEVVKKVLNSELGYNAKNNEYVDMIKEGIIDPAKVTITSLENAASVAATLLTTGCAIVEKDNGTSK